MVQQITNEKYPLVSIVTPSYNQGQFIEDTIVSVKNQDYPNIEHIIVDGESIDNTLEILKKYEGTYNMRWISEPDEGQADAINKGFDMAEGEIIGWLNSDDLYFDKGTISFVVQIFEEDEDIDMLYGHAVKINADNRLMRIKPVPRFNYERLKRLCYIIQPSLFFRRQVVEQEKLDISLQYGMDYEYWLRLGEKFVWKRVDRILSADRNHAQRKIIADRTKARREEKKLRKKYGFHGFPFYVLQFFDKLRYRWWRCIGLLMLNELRRDYRYAFPIEFDRPIVMIYHQLFRKDRKLL